MPSRDQAGRVGCAEQQPIIVPLEGYEDKVGNDTQYCTPLGTVW
jgi:hypothetical protein